MDLSNKALGLLLVAAIVVSIGGTIVSLNRLDGISTTGFATQNDTGEVILTVADALSVTLAVNTIDFGECSIDTTQGHTFVDSAQGPSAVNNSLCSNSSLLPSYLVLDNDGNLNANVTLLTDANGSQLFNTAASWIAYTVINGTEPGCTAAFPSATNFTLVGLTNHYQLCDNLSFTDGTDELNVSIMAYVDSTSQNGGTMNLTFAAFPLA